MKTKLIKENAFFFVLLLTLVSCTEPELNGPVNGACDASLRTLGKPAAHYLIEYAGNSGRAEAAVQSAGGVVEKTMSAIGVIKASGLTEIEAAGLLTQPGIQYVTRDVEVQWVPDFSGTAIAHVQAMGPMNTTGHPADATAFKNGRQWGLIAINAPQAWSITMGSTEIRVGILDTGISPTHQDLEGKYDLLKSINLSTANAQDPSDYIDRHFHGTFVSGIISSNNIIVAGVSPNVTMVGIKVLNDQGWGPWANILDGILYAVDEADCDILNLSLGGHFPKAQNGRLLAMFQRTINHARSKGALVVCAAGNLGWDLDHWQVNAIDNIPLTAPEIVMPAQAAGAMTISATGPSNGTNPDGIAPYTNYGISAISVAAPGGIGKYSVFDYILSCAAPAVTGNNSSYYWGCGTSFSAPHVAGVAALVETVTGNSYPGYLQSHIQNTADDLGRPGVDVYYGKGRLNAEAAVR
ncbi:MAG: S8 family serine peptidase [Bacteroidetes bacterium]|nr:S8 family serine peptidase [Bacteroidota bacterium]